VDLLKNKMDSASSNSPNLPSPGQPIRNAVAAYSTPKRLESLDSIRGLAALAVLLGHTTAAFVWPDYTLAWSRVPIINAMFDGRSAVTMFFVLSGFVLSRPYLEISVPGQPARRLFLLTFYLRRFTRIWIPWFCAFALSAVARAYLFHTQVTQPPASDWRDAFWHYHLSVSDVLRQCAFLVHDSTQTLLPQDWSLGSELKGSALIPFLVFVARKDVRWFAPLGILFLIFLPAGQLYVSFVLGVALAKYYPALELKLRSLSLLSKIGILTVGIVLYGNRAVANYFWAVHGTIDKAVWTICSVGCVLILAASLSSKRIQSKLNLPPVLFLGRISFSFYLLQFIVILCALPPFIQLLNGWGIQNPWALLPLSVAASVFITTVAAALMYWTVEVPTIQLGHRLTKAIQAKLVRANKQGQFPEAAASLTKSDGACDNIKLGT
jgi:peptidoglycan/LPS O-acetylase OafA/YrhL